jgi:hypothetical protein
VSAPLRYVLGASTDAAAPIDREKRLESAFRALAGT